MVKVRGSLAGLNRRTWVRHIPEVSCIFYGWRCHPDFEEMIEERSGWCPQGTGLVQRKAPPPLSPCSEVEDFMVPGRQ